MSPPLVLAAHGSREPDWQRTVDDVAAAVRRRRPELEVRLGYVDVQAPSVADVLVPGAIVVPLMLSRGHHVAHDIEAPAAAGGAFVTAPVGPDPSLCTALRHRLAEAGVPDGVPVVLAGAGSSDPAAREQVAAQARHLAVARGTPVHAAYAGGATEPVAEAVRALRGAGPGRVAVAAYLLAPGHFTRLLSGCGADWVSAPLGAHPALVDVVLGRHDDVLNRSRMSG